MSSLETCNVFSFAIGNDDRVEVYIPDLTCLHYILLLWVTYASIFILSLSYLQRNVPLGFKKRLILVISV